MAIPSAWFGGHATMQYASFSRCKEILLQKWIVMDNSGLLQRQKRILIICDDQDVTMSFGSVLEQNGYMTDSYTDPVLAYKNFRDGQYDLVLLDIKMPVVDGFLLYQRIRSIDSWVKIWYENMQNS